MKILQASVLDFAGVAIKLSNAINPHTEHECRAIREPLEGGFLNYEADIESDKKDVWEEWVNWADVVVIHEYIEIYRRIKEISKKKPLVWMAHGRYYRSYHESVEDILNTDGIPLLCSTMDLVQIRPDSIWMPFPINIEVMQKYRDPAEEFLVVQSYIDPVHKIDIPGVSVDSFTGVSNEEALTRKGKATVFVDRFLDARKQDGHAYGPFAPPCSVDPTQLMRPGGVGVSAVEAMAIGVPVLLGTLESSLRHMRKSWGQLPFWPSTKEELPQQLALLKEDPALREWWTERGSTHVRENHDDKKVAEAFGKFCEAYLG